MTLYAEIELPTSKTNIFLATAAGMYIEVNMILEFKILVVLKASLCKLIVRHYYNLKNSTH